MSFLVAFLKFCKNYRDFDLYHTYLPIYKQYDQTIFDQKIGKDGTLGWVGFLID